MTPKPNTHPHLPPPLGTLSLWQRTVRSHPLLNSNSTSPLPPSADVVVVGGGLCGALVAYSIVTRKPDTGEVPKVVLLEARELASGASGRNAGHCRPDVARGFNTFADIHGGPEAREIIESEARVLELANAFIEKHQIPCEWTLRTTYDASLSPAFTTHVQSSAAGLSAVGGTPGHDHLQGEAAKETRTPAPDAFRWPAATLNPAKLTLGVHALARRTGRYEAYTWAPVWSVDEDGQEGWIVKTPRGEVRAKKVVFATNAYSSAVVPGLDGLVEPQRAQAHKLTPPPNPAFAPLTASYSLRYTPERFFSVAPRPDGTVVLGVSRKGHGGIAAAAEEEVLNTVDDSTFHPALAKLALDAHAGMFPGSGWGSPPYDEKEAREGKAKGTPLVLESERARKGITAGDYPPPRTEKDTSGFEYGWTGTIGMTPDYVPFVGAVPGKKGQYAAVGFNGHGMARIFLVAPALVNYIYSGNWDEHMPESFILSSQRLARLRAAKERGEAKL